MPEVLANTTEAALQTWLIEEGQSVTTGQPVAEIETEKAMVEFNSEFDGTLLRHLVQPGDTVEVGAPIAVFGAAGENVDIDALLATEGLTATTPAAPAAAAPAAATPDPESGAPTLESPALGAVAESNEPAPVPAQAGQGSPATGGDGGRRFISPLVRRLAREHGLDLSTVTGSGPDGRIVRRDVDALLAAGAAAPTQPAPTTAPTPAPAAAPVQVPAAGGYTDIPHTGMRKAIARRLTESKSTVPHFYLTAHCRVDKLLDLRTSVNESAPRKVSVNDFVVKAVAAALTDVPNANVIWTDAASRRFDSVDLAVAVSTDGGLLTPVLRGVQAMSLTTISSTIADLAERARAGRLKQHELEGGSFSVTNLGMYGVDEFSAILNPPQSGILAVGAAKQQPVVDDGQLTVGTVMTVTLSADHRVLDGALAAEWLAAFVKRIENPLSILI
ncbi:MAG: dihydrolipoamide acetyltransferase family protein [Microbacteriaceae bacterium]